MIGALLIFGCLGAAAVSGFKGWMDDAAGYERGKEREARGENPWGTYRDGHGCNRDLRTGEYRNVTYDYETGDTILRGQYQKFVGNLSEEWRQKRYQELKNNHPDWQTAMYYGELKKSIEWTRNCVTGCKWKDLRTGTIYVARTYDNISFYMNMTTGEFVRVSDSQILNNKRIEDEYAARGLDPSSNLGYATEERISKCREKRRKELADYRNRTSGRDNKMDYSRIFALNSKESIGDSLLGSDEKKLMGELAPRFYA